MATAIERARQAFGVLLGNYGRAMYFASRYVGGVYVNRDHKGDANGQPPFVVVPPAKQRDAHGPASKSKSSATSRSSSRRTCTTTWPRLALEPLGSERRPSRLDYCRARCDRHVAGPDSAAIDVVADAGAAARLGTEGAGRSGRLHHGGVDRPADQVDLRRGRRHAKPATTRPQAGRLRACGATCSEFT